MTSPVGLRFGLCAVACGFAGLSVARSTHAQSSVHGTGSVGLTWTDNVTNTPDRRSEDDPERLSAWLLSLVPGVAFYHQTPTAEYTASYAHPFQIYLTLDRPVQESDVVTLGGTLALSERDQLVLGLLGTYARTSDNLSIPTVRASTAPIPTGSQRVVNFTASEELIHALSESWSLGQETSAEYSVPVLDPENEPGYYAVGAGFSIRHRRPRDTYRVGVGGSYLGSTLALPESIDGPAPYSADVAATWAHQISRSLNSLLGVGSAVVLDNRRDARLFFAPTATGLLTHSREFMTESIAVSRTLQQDVLAGSVFIDSSVRLSIMTAILPRAGVSARTDHAFSKSSAVLQNSVGDVDVWTSEVGIDWAAIPGTLGAGISYQYLRQWGGYEGAAFSDLHRNQVMLVVGGQFPRQGIQLNHAGPIGDSRRPIGGPASQATTPAFQQSTTGGDAGGGTVKHDGASAGDGGA